MGTYKDLVVAIEPSVDWITATLKSRGKRDFISEWANEHLDACLALGEHVSLWNSFGYDGWSVSGMRWGRRPQDDLIQLSGSLANAHWALVVGAASNVTRIDLAVTVKFKHHLINLEKDEYETIGKLAQDLPIIRNYAIISSLLGGDTLYVGSRSSSQFGRIYDKGLESNAPEFANCHRWEVEYKKPLAQVAAQALIAGGETEPLILSVVKQWFDERLIYVPWEATERTTAIAILRKETTDDRALRWLERQVGPTVSRLVARGKSGDVLKALGIPLMSNVKESS